MLTFNALVAATEVIIPVETGFFSLRGPPSGSAPSSRWATLGVTPSYRLLPTCRRRIARELLDELKRRFPGRHGPGHRYDQHPAAASFGQPVIEYAHSTGARTTGCWPGGSWPTSPRSRRDGHQEICPGVMGQMRPPSPIPEPPAAEAPAPPARAGAARLPQDHHPARARRARPAAGPPAGGIAM
jgi:hypothetical protein